MLNTCDSPRKVESELTQEKNLKYGLYDFVISLVDIQRRWPSSIYEINEKRIHWADFWNEENERLRKLKRHIIHTIDIHLKRVGFWSPIAFGTTKSRNEYIIEKYELEPFFQFIGKESKKFENAAKMPRKKGRPIKLKGKIALLWSLVIRVNNRTNWKFIVDLIDWFAFNLKDTYFEKELEGIDGVTDHFHLKRQIYGLKKQKDNLEMAKKLKSYYFPQEINKKIYLINFKKKGASLHNIELLKGDIKHYLKYKQHEISRDFKINLIEYYQRHRTVPLIIFPNGLTFP